MDPFVARPAFWHLLLMFIASLSFVVAGFWIAGLIGITPKPGKEWIGWLSIVFFGFCSVVIFFQLFDKDDQVRISSFGIYYKQWSRDTIPWSEISKISVREFKQQKTILLHLRNADRFPSTTWRGTMAVANRTSTGGYIGVNLQGTDGKFEDAMSAIAWFQANQGASNVIAATSGHTGFGKKGL